MPSHVTIVVVRIAVDDLSGPEVAALLRLHLRAMHDASPAESVHALGLEALRSPDVTVWAAWDGDVLMGIGALRVEPAAAEGEIKSMRTDPRFLGRGVGRAILRTIISEARRRGLERLCLETGTDESFAPAHALYLSEGFVPCGPFGTYAEDPYSRFFTRAVESPSS